MSVEVGEGSMDTGDTDTQSSWCSHSSADSATHNQPDDHEAPFYFESDHLALRGNKDFQKLLSTLALLEAQRMQAAKDLDILLQAQKDSLKDPIAFVDKLQHKQDVGLPKRQRIASIPSIAWEKYTTNFDPSTIGQSHRTVTRFRQKVVSRPSSPSGSTVQETSNGQLPITSELVIKSEAESAESSRAPSPLGLEINGHSHVVVRGRVKEENKPETFNVLWTNEEQGRLEELLLKFPPERVEARRWEKIAKALGNRTTQQVASRVQKYFIKLAKAGLPIPGRMPNVNHYVKRTNHRHQRYNRFYYQSSTFMASYEPPVYMSDEEDSYSSHAWSHPLHTNGDSNEPLSDDEDISPEMKSTPEYQEYLNLKQMRRSLLQKQSHLGYKCDRCESEPILGTRWHCVDCPAETSVDFCSNCCNSKYEEGTHTGSHRLEAIKPPQSGTSYVDNDYTKFMPGDYNYLDPNYMPAV